MRDSKLKWFLVGIYERLYDLRRIIIREGRYGSFVSRYRLRIMSSEQTLEYILKKKCSIARFGDGEFDLIRKQRELSFQKASDHLAQALNEVLETDTPGLLLCIPGVLNSIRGTNWRAAMYWTRWGIDENKHHPTIEMIRRTGKIKYLFGDSQISRPYIDWRSSKRAKRVFPMLMRLWDKKDILIVEGEKTRLGVGNDLFSNANSIKRILAPAINAFDQREEIMDAIIKQYNGELIVLALGPTATVLAAKLSARGIQALDLGHVDVEYEWFLAGAKQKQLIPGKYLNEVIDGQNPEECFDELYLKQIVARIGC